MFQKGGLDIARSVSKEFHSASDLHNTSSFIISRRRWVKTVSLRYLSLKIPLVLLQELERSLTHLLVVSEEFALILILPQDYLSLKIFL